MGTQWIQLVSQHVATFEPVGIRQEYFNAIKTNEKVTLGPVRSAREGDGESTCLRVSEQERENNKMSVNQANPRHVSASRGCSRCVPVPFLPSLSFPLSHKRRTRKANSIWFLLVLFLLLLPGLAWQFAILNNVGAQPQFCGFIGCQTRDAKGRRSRVRCAACASL